MNTQKILSPMPGRSFNSDKYRFSFNGKEKDDEVKGEGNNIAFDERGYNPRIGRWWSVDPLFAKYPSQSPYSFVGNSPILNREIDGRDYGVYINHADRTIIIKATIYTTKADQGSATKAAMHWNGQNGKFQYRVGEGVNAALYDVKFDVQLVIADDEVQRDEEFGNANCVEANRYSVGTPINNYDGTTTPANGGGDNDITVKDGTDVRSTGSHELGHAFGLGHWLSGLMRSGDYREDDETAVTQGMVSKILSRTGIGQLYENGNDQKYSPPANEAKFETHSYGNEPSNFNSGSVEDCTN